MKVLLVTNMYPTSDRPALGTFVANQVEALRHDGLDVDVLFIDGGKNTLNYLWGIPRLWTRMLTRRYALIHAHYVFTGFIARAQFLYPVVLTHHGIEVLKGRQAILSRIITPLMDHVIVTSEEMKAKLRWNRVDVIPCGVDLDLFKPLPQRECRRSLNLPMDKKLILVAGRFLSPEKRFDIVQEAIRQLQQRIPDTELILVADEPYNSMPVYMNACDVLLLVSNAEGSPMVVKEAMACNLPIVSVAVGDVPDVVGGTDGCFICTQDPSDVAEKLEKAVRDLRRTQGRERVSRFALSETSGRIVDVYKKTLRDRRLRLKGWGKRLINHKESQ